MEKINNYIIITKHYSRYSHSPRRSTAHLLSPSSPKAQLASAWYTRACWGLNSTVTLRSSPGFSCPVSGDSWNGGSTNHLNTVWSLLGGKHAFGDVSTHISLDGSCIFNHPIHLYLEFRKRKLVWEHCWAAQGGRITVSGTSRAWWGIAARRHTWNVPSLHSNSTASTYSHWKEVHTQIQDTFMHYH